MDTRFASSTPTGFPSVALYLLVCALLVSCAVDRPVLRARDGATTQYSPGISSRTPTARETALTEMKSWAPVDAVQFKNAEACYDAAQDEYTIAAVYTRRTASTGREWDAAYLLRVAGDEASSDYGELVHAMFVEGADRIDHIDCAADDSGRVYVAFDRYGDNAVWYRYEDTERNGPYEITAPGVGCSPNSHMPRLAVSEGASPTVFVAFEGYSFEGFHGAGETESCEACVMAFDGLSGEVRFPGEMIWNDNMTHERYDVAWNGDDRFVWALPYHADAGYPHLDVYTYAESGERLDHHPIQNFGHNPVPGYPRRVELVYTDGASNPRHRFALVTDRRSVYWLNQDGSRHGSPAEGGLASFVSCAYLGPSQNIAHTFHPELRWDLRRIYATLRFGTAHKHWKSYPTGPRDQYSTTAGYFPAACDAGSSTVDDPELLLASTNVFGDDPKVYWHLETQH